MFPPNKLLANSISVFGAAAATASRSEIPPTAIPSFSSTSVFTVIESIWRFSKCSTENRRVKG
jgi:hypothetical protein